MKLTSLAGLAFVFGVTAHGAMAQVTGGLGTSAPMSGQFCAETRPNGSRVLYPAKPMSIDWRGKTYPVTGSVWANQTPGRHQALSAALKAARGSDAPPLDLGRGGVTAVRSTAGGVLIATDDGEWGGAVWFFVPGEQPRKVVDANTVGLFDIGGSPVALTGLAHMTLDYGAVFRLDLSAPTPTATSLAKLPAAPRAWAVADDALLLATGQSGVAVLADGTVELASVKRECKGLAGLLGQ